MEDLSLEKEYIRMVIQIQNLQEDGFYAVYGLESQRVDAHERLCAKYKVDYQDAKELTLFLDRKIGLPVGVFDMDECIEIEEKYAPILADAFRELHNTKS